MVWGEFESRRQLAKIGKPGQVHRMIGMQLHEFEGSSQTPPAERVA